MNDDDRGTHPLSTGYLVVGLLFLGLAAAWALRATDVIDADGVQWVLPAVLLLAGAAGLAGSLGKSRRRSRRTAPGSEDALSWSDRTDTDPTLDPHGEQR